MSNVDLGGSLNKTVPQEKQKMIYMSIPTSLVFIADAMQFEPMQKYADAIAQSIKSSLTNVEIRKSILQVSGVKTVKKMQRLRKDHYDLFTKVFGEEIWGLQK